MKIIGARSLEEKNTPYVITVGPLSIESNCMRNDNVTINPRSRAARGAFLIAAALRRPRHADTANGKQKICRSNSFVSKIEMEYAIRTS
jgi:hypothetical protein